jgi:hypothetical protein
VVSDIESFLEQILSIKQDAPGIADGLTDEQFNWQPAQGRWSIGQCLEHLNITAEKYLPVLDAAIDSARRAGRTSAGPFAYGFVERFFARTMEPPVQRRWMRAPAAFQASGRLAREPVMARFLAMQEGLDARVRRADGVDLRHVKVKSQFGPMRFSLGQTFQILLAHERRHVWQAREVRKAIAGS